MPRKVKRPAALSRACSDALQALRALGGEARTVQIAAAMEKPAPIANLVMRLDTLERNGLVTSSRTLDGIERVWKTEPRRG